MPYATKPLSPETEKFVKKALDVLRSLKLLDYCPRCSENDWNVDYLAIPALTLPSTALQWDATPFQRSGYLPMLAIVCKKCGYTMFHNANVLDIQKE